MKDGHIQYFEGVPAWGQPREAKNSWSYLNRMLAAAIHLPLCGRSAAKMRFVDAGSDTPSACLHRFK